MVMIVGYVTIGALIASRTERNPIGWLLMMIGVGFLLGGFTDEYLRYALPRGPGDQPFILFSAWLTNWVFSIVAFPVPWILLLFPDGKLPTRRWKPVGIAIAVLEGILLLGFILSPGPIDVDFPGLCPRTPPACRRSRASSMRSSASVASSSWPSVSPRSARWCSGTDGPSGRSASRCAGSSRPSGSRPRC